MRLIVQLAGYSVASIGLGVGVYMVLAMIRGVLAEGAQQSGVKYVRGTQFVVFTVREQCLLEDWDGRAHGVTFRSPLEEDLRLRMEHRDEVLRRQGFVPQSPWQALFQKVDAPLIEE